MGSHTGTLSKIAALPFLIQIPIMCKALIVKSACLIFPNDRASKHGIGQADFRPIPQMVQGPVPGPKLSQTYMTMSAIDVSPNLMLLSMLPAHVHSKGLGRSKRFAFAHVALKWGSKRPKGFGRCPLYANICNRQFAELANCIKVRFRGTRQEVNPLGKRIVTANRKSRR